MNTPHSAADALDRPISSYLGLGPFLRLSIAGGDLQALGFRLLAALADDPDNPVLLLNAAAALQSLGQNEAGLLFQSEALAHTNTYYLEARLKPAKLRLLVLVAPGAMNSNTPIDCLLENSDIDLIFCYLRDDMLQADIEGARALEHDIVLVGIDESEATRPLLAALTLAFANWPNPVMNQPQHLWLTDRDAASHSLQNIAGLLMPQTVRVDGSTLHAIADGQKTLPGVVGDMNFPVIVRPVGSQGGYRLSKLETPKELSNYLAEYCPGGVDDTFFIAPFIDYRDAQGQFKKIRVALIDGQAYVCHMGISSHWMIHYVNAGMYEDAQKRQQEAEFMAKFDEFVQRHQGALQAICRQLPLDYLVMDCAETQSGDLLVFEIDHVGVVHAMDLESLFPYKQQQMQQVKQAFRTALIRRLKKNSNSP
jgi:glutathione synthase/RimK-type ligase-like ATP-grasp enzyme